MLISGAALVPAMLMVSLWRVRPKAAGGK